MQLVRSMGTRIYSYKFVKILRDARSELLNTQKNSYIHNVMRYTLEVVGT